MLLNGGMLAASYGTMVIDAGYALTNQPSDDLFTNFTGRFPSSPSTLGSVLKNNGVTWGLWVTPAFQAQSLQMGYAGQAGTNLVALIANANRWIDWGIGFLKIDGVGGTLYNTNSGLYSYANGQLNLLSSVYQQRNATLVFDGGTGRGISSPEQTRTVSGRRAPDDGINFHYWLINKDWAETNLISNLAAGIFLDCDAVQGYGSANSDGGSAKQRIELSYNALFPMMTQWSDVAGSNSFAAGKFSTESVGFWNRNYLNPEMLALQTNLPIIPAKIVSRSVSDPTQHTNLTEVWSRPYGDGSYSVGLFNLNVPTQSATNISATLQSLGLPNTLCTVRDIWGRAFIDYVTNGTVAYSVNTNNVKLLRVYPYAVNPFSDGTNWLSGYEYNLLTYSNGVDSSGTSHGKETWRIAGGIYTEGLQYGYGTNYYNNPITINGVVYTNYLSFFENGGATWWLGGNVSQIGFSLGFDAGTVTFAGALPPTNVVTVFADGVQIFQATIITNAPLITTNISVIGVQNISVTVNMTNNPTNPDRVMTDLVNFYAYRPIKYLNGNGVGITNLPYAKTFTSTNGYFTFLVNSDGSTNVTFVATNIPISI
ncbi:MAG TPA: NPCBM/NEW2 domain-containing protein, partial [Puia sp.]|nr:NPCBM/NEW2 domain-containing protein [Puia sp.]